MNSPANRSFSGTRLIIERVAEIHCTLWVIVELDLRYGASDPILIHFIHCHFKAHIKMSFNFHLTSCRWELTFYRYLRAQLKELARIEFIEQRVHLYRYRCHLQ